MFTVEFFTNNIYASGNTLADCPDTIKLDSIDELSKLMNTDGVFLDFRNPITWDALLYCGYVYNKSREVVTKIYTDRTNF